MLSEEERKESRRVSSKKYYEANRARIKVRRDANTDKMKEYSAKHYLDNKRTYKAKAKKWYGDNNAEAKRTRKKYRKNHRNADIKASQKNRDALGDCYVKTLLTKRGCLSFRDIPQGLIEAKRSHLKVKRFIKEQENG